MSESRILVRLLWMYFPRNWEFGSALSKLWNFGGFKHPNPTLGTPLVAVFTELCSVLRFGVVKTFVFDNILLKF
jgi:hypothetical protein